MGQTLTSHPDSERPVKILEGEGLSAMASYMSSEKCKNVFVMVGAGISTAAGIPDFRSPGTGLYANLARFKLPYPEAVFEIDYFRDNPLPFYTLAQELYPGQFRPTLTHSFIRLLHSHSILHTCFTQNIDTLERRAGIPGDRLVEAHGSFASNRCIDCHAVYNHDTMKQKIKDREIPKCTHCGGLAKPDIVFFGEQLPPRFFQCALNLRAADLLICIGTSLAVAPFSSLVGMIPPGCPRLFINLNLVGNFGTQINDVVCLGKCDDIVQKLCKELGWEEELTKAWAETKDSIEAMDKKKQDVSSEEKTKPQEVVDEVDNLASKMEKGLALQDVITSLAAKQDQEDIGPSTDVHTLSGQPRPDVDDPAKLEDTPPAKGEQTDRQEEVDESEGPERPQGLEGLKEKL